jgi:hypothetical protein
MRAAIVALLVLSWFPGPVAAQSMAEAARKEAERREKNKKAGVKAKAYGDADLSSSGTGPAAGGADKPPAADPSTARSESDAESEQRRQDEIRWRARVAEATARRDQAKAVYEEMSKLSLAQGEVYVDDNNKVIVSGVGDLRAKIARAKARSEAAEEALQGLLEEARRAGVPPGWLR